MSVKTINVCLIIILMICILQNINAQSIDCVKQITLNDSTYKTGSVYTFDSISFLLGSYKLSPRSYDELDLVVSFLNDNLDIKVEIVVYGFINPISSNILPQSRANHISDYIISKGIDVDRITSKGFCCNWSNRECPKTDTDIKCHNLQIEMVIK